MFSCAAVIPSGAGRGTARPLQRLRRLPRLVALIAVATLAGCVTSQIEAPTAPAGDPAAGQLTLPGGRIVAIYPAELNYSGYATYRWPDGRVYEGTFEAGMPQGIGQETLPDGEHYSGTWQGGQRHGHGELTQPDGSRYVGDFIKGLREGDGSEETPAGLYLGQWADDLPEGQGSYHAINGMKYEGSWRQGKREGWGEHVDPQSNRYEGDWAGDQPHGFGTFTGRDSSSYYGEWRAGKRFGYGVLADGAGNSYEGIWIDGKRGGYGLESRADGSSYRGEWSVDKRQGKGKETYADGSYHDGLWENDKALGPGTRSNHYGLVISGVWNDDKVSTGLLTLPTGLEYAGALFSKGNREVARGLLAWLEQGAASGDPYAELLLATAFQDFSQPRPDPMRARALLKLAAAAGIAEAQFRLALTADEGNAPRKIELLAAAAKQGHAAANETLARYYYSGHLVPRNRATAVRYYEQAITAGSRQARNDLAWLLATTPEDELRNGARAVQLMEPLVRLYGGWQQLDTLAAAYAENGRFERAAAAQRQALQQVPSERGALTDDALIQEMQLRLEQYQHQRPHREL